MGVERPLRPWGLVALAFFVVGDLIFILIHIRLMLTGHLHHNVFDLGHEGGVPEWFNYSKWAIGGLACAYAYYRRREPLYFAWAALFIYLLLDDSMEFHEHVGRALRDDLTLPAGILGRAQNLGEALAAAMIMASLFVMMAVAYVLNGAGSARSFTWRMTPGLVLLFVAGVCFDVGAKKLMPMLWRTWLRRAMVGSQHHRGWWRDDRRESTRINRHRPSGSLRPTPSWRRLSAFQPGC